MKRIINRKCYDTELATRVASAHNGYYNDDFRYEREELYLTKSGAWFLHGEGGALSSYAENHGRDRTGGEELRPLSPDDAYAWLEKNQKVEAIATYFSTWVDAA